MKEWHQVVSSISPSVVKIETPDGHGTGFLCAYNADKTLVGIATAHHVVGHADKWQQPIRIHNLTKDTTIFLQEADRVIIPDSLKDSAVIIIFSEARIKALDLPEEPIGFIAPGKHSITGVEVGWLGYPSIDRIFCPFFALQRVASGQYAYPIMASLAMASGKTGLGGIKRRRTASNHWFVTADSPSESERRFRGFRLLKSYSLPESHNHA